MTDYRDLLKKYMTHILRMESRFYIGEREAENFTDAERDVLTNIAVEIKSELT